MLFIFAKEIYHRCLTESYTHLWKVARKQFRPIFPTNRETLGTTKTMAETTESKMYQLINQI